MILLRAESLFTVDKRTGLDVKPRTIFDGHDVYLPAAIINYIALLGWCPKDNSEKMTMQEMIEKFSLDGVSKSPAIFDDLKLRWLNGEYLKEMTDEEFLSVALPFIKKSKVYGKYDENLIAQLMKTRVEILSEIPEKIDFLEEFGEYDTSLFVHKKMKTDETLAKEILPLVRQTVSDLKDFSHDGIHDALINLAVEKGYKNGQVLWTARVALTGKDVTPGGAIEMAQLLGKERTLERLDFSIRLLG